jgi:glycosyltransferase involved in cell wall biosynthesis
VYLAELRALCTELGVAESVRFLGHVSDEHLVSLYRQAAALVHPAIREDFGLAILEAMALGAPVIAAAVDGPRELIRTGENGLLVPPGDSRPLAEVVIEILESAGLAESLSKGGWQFAETLSAIAMAEQTAAIYADVLAERVESSRVA